MIYEHEPTAEQRRIIEQDHIEVPMKVVAGAGTGKTFVLAHRFVWLVTEKGMSPSRILTLTFGNAAAAEMRTRIKALLRRNGCRVSGELWIQTFHSFATRIIGDYSYQAGWVPDPDILNDTRRHLELESILDELLAGDFAQQAALQPEALSGLGLRDAEQLRQAVRQLIGRAKSYGWTPEQFREHALERCEAFYEALLTPQEAWGLEDPQQIPFQLQERLARNLGDARIGAIDVADKARNRDVRKLYYKELRRLTPRENIGGLIERQHRQERALIEVAARVYELYQQRLSEAGALDYDDQILRAIELLEEGERRIGRELAEYFEYILVDEFQDTSPAQMRLLQAVAREPQRVADRPVGKQYYPRMMIVGDKKQSIYGWRHADPENMDRLLPFGPDDRIDGVPVWWSLTENWRSDQRIIEVANKAGQEAGPEDPLLVGQSRQPGEAVAWEPFVPVEGERIRHARRREADFIAGQIVQLVNSAEFKRRGLRLGDIAVLMRTRSSFRFLKPALERRGIPYQDQAGVGFFDHPIARDILAWLRVLSDPFDSASLVRLLQRPPLNLSDRELFLLSTRPEQRKAADDELRRTARPLCTAISELVSGRDSWRTDQERAELPVEQLAQFHRRFTTLQQYASTHPAEAVVNELFRMTEACGGMLSDSERQSAAAVRATFEAIIRELGGNGRRRPGLDEVVAALDLYQNNTHLELPVPHQPVSNAVQIMTVHKAKGLGFGVVFLLAWDPRQSRGRRGIEYDERWGIVGPRVDDDVDVKNTCYKLYGHDERDREDARLWYVAVTRAKHWLHVTHAAKAGAKGGAGGLPFAKTLPQPRPRPEGEEAGVVACLEAMTGGTALLPRPASVVPAIPPRRVVTSFSGLREFIACPARWWISHRWGAGEELLGDEDEEDGAKVGSYVHRFIADFYRRQGAGQDEEQIRKLRNTDELTPEDGQRLTALTRAFINSRWAALRPPPEAVERNVRLVYPTCPEVELRGRIDLLMTEPAVRIVDFKTNRHLGERELAAYALQMAIYQRAIQAEGIESPAEPVIVHLRASGVVEHRVKEETIAQCLNELDSLVRRLSEVVAEGVLPAAPQQPPCTDCPYRPLCPVRSSAEEGEQVTAG